MSQKIKITPNMYNGMKVKLLVNVKDVMDVFGERIFEAGTIGNVTKYNPVMGRVSVQIGNHNISVKTENTEIVYP